tara:strand:- start:56681 stop:57988 length:1308 start_codon:yes stop_codon:yes gene_type:complete
MANILVVDDQATVRYTLREILSEAGHTIIEADCAKAALARVSDVDLVLTDYAMPDISGLELLDAIRKSHAGMPVVMLTARGSEETAVAALKAGASDYLVKPANVDELCLAVERALEMAQLRRDNRVLRAGNGTTFIGESKAATDLVRLIERVAAKGLGILVCGETGTGKEIVANLLHAHSERASGPLIRFNCGAVPENLAASELFGHVRGAFTGADRDREGFFQQAHQGTLVLDEIAELPLNLQPLLLRAIQEGEVQKVGAPRIDKVDVRLVACTHRNLKEAVAAGQFREDLYYRLAVMEIAVPPLRERTSDIPLLARHLVRKYQERFGMESLILGEKVLEWLSAQPWPGNVRELENCLLRMMALADGDTLEIPSGAPEVMAQAGPLRSRMAAFEVEILRETMLATGGNQSEAARRLGVTRVTLIDKLKRHGLKK